MNLYKLSIFGFLLSLSAFGEPEILECPPGSYEIQYVSPITKNVIRSCGYRTDEKVVKHGPEWTINSVGKVVSRVYFNQGKETPFPEEPKTHSDDPIVKKGLAAITQLFRILTFGRDRVVDGNFKIHGCDKDQMAWLKGALNMTPISKSYVFGDRCDVFGNFIAKFGEEFTVQFNLRNLDEFNHTKMQVRLDLRDLGRSMLYRFSALSGTLSSPLNTAEFSGEYEVEVSKTTGKVDLSTQKGKIIMSKLNGKDINLLHTITF